MKEQIMRMPDRQIYLIGWSVPLLLVAAFASYLIKPEFKRWDGARTAIDNAIVASASVDLDAQLDWLNREIDSLEQRLHGDGASRPAREMESFVIGRLQTISWGHEMELIGIEPNEGAFVNGYEELLFDVRLEGDYFDFYRWLDDVSTQLGFVVVKHFDIGRSTTADGIVPKLNIRLTMAAYRRAT